MIEMGRTYKTRNGRDVRLVAVDNDWVFGIVGAARPCMWNADTGKASSRFDDLGGADTDLVEVKPTITRTYWLIHWAKGDSSICFFAPIAADEMQPQCIAVTGPHEITFTEGEGL